jgi:sugar O-acyltransferase (sialic acid O-acetyltransferase NeuD family)
MVNSNFDLGGVGVTVVGLLGAGGFGREVMPLIRNHISSMSQFCPSDVFQVCFVEKNPTRNSVNNCLVISEDDFIKVKCHQKLFNVAIAESKLRASIANEFISKGLEPLSIYSQNSIIYDCNEVAEGVIMCANTMITSNVKIGKFFHANIYSYIGHDCVIGDYVTFAPDVHCNGNVHIGDYAYIGAGAVIKQGSTSKPLTIGEGAIIGMGAVVTKDVPPFVTVVGNPARII